MLDQGGRGRDRDPHLVPGLRSPPQRWPAIAIRCCRDPLADDFRRHHTSPPGLGLTQCAIKQRTWTDRFTTWTSEAPAGRLSWCTGWAAAVSYTHLRAHET